MSSVITLLLLIQEILAEHRAMELPVVVSSHNIAGISASLSPETDQLDILHPSRLGQQEITHACSELGLAFAY